MSREFNADIQMRTPPLEIVELNQFKIKEYNL